MRTSRWLLGVMGFLLWAQAAGADVTVFTDETQFLANVQPGFYNETFTGLPDGLLQSPQSFAKNGFAYNTQSVGGFFVQSVPPVKWLGDGASQGDPIKISITSGNVTAIGGNFFNTDASRSVPASSILFLLLSDGTQVTVDNPTDSTFRGFLSSTPIASLLLTPDPKFNATLTNLTVGAAVPEPSSLTLLGLAGVLGAALGLRKRV